MSNLNLGAIGTNPPRHRRTPLTIKTIELVTTGVAVFVLSVCLWFQYSYKNDIYLSPSPTPLQQSSPVATPLMAPTAPIMGLPRAP